MTFPLMPNITSGGGSGPTYNYVKRATTTGDGFPNTTVSLTAGTKLVVVCCELAGFPVNYVRFDGVDMTLVAPTTNPLNASVWVIETSATSGTITGSGGSGRSSIEIYEIFNYSSVTPTVSGYSKGSGTESITLNTSTNMVVLGAGLCNYSYVAVTADLGPTPITNSIILEGATGHFSWAQQPTARGATTYTAPVSPGGTDTEIAAAAWR